jgi:hypothetical protein
VDCPLKKVRFQSTHQADAKLKLESEAVQVRSARLRKDRRHMLTHEMLLRLYESGLVKFPTSIGLRISYIGFLTTVMRSKQHALAEIIDAEKFKCTLDQKCVLFNIRRQIETEISNL